MIPENFPLAENIGPGHVPRHGSVTGTATERQQPLPCRLQAPAGNAAVFPGQAPRFGEPFFLAMCRSVRTRQTAHGEGALGKMPTAGASGQSRWKGPLPLCRARRLPVFAGRPGKDMRALRQGTHRGAPPYDSPAEVAAGLRRWALSATGMGQGRRVLFLPALPYVCNRTAAAERRLRWRGKKRLVAVGACHLRAFGLWKLVHRSTLRQRPGVPGNALRRIFRCLPVMGPGRRQAGLQGLGRCGRSQPFWRIEKWLTSA